MHEMVMRWLCKKLNYMKLIGNTNCLTGVLIIRNRTLKINKEINHQSNEQINIKKMLLSSAIKLFPEM